MSANAFLRYSQKTLEGEVHPPPPPIVRDEQLAYAVHLRNTKKHAFNAIANRMWLVNLNKMEVQCPHFTIFEPLTHFELS